MKKISEWLNESLDGHSMGDAQGLADSFKAATGLDADWPTVSKKQAAKAARASGGYWNGDTNGRAAYGFWVADHLARKHVPGYNNPMMGKGSSFRFAVSELARVGK